jgi:hypothetical protein
MISRNRRMIERRAGSLVMVRASSLIHQHGQMSVLLPIPPVSRPRLVRGIATITRHRNAPPEG